MYKLEEAYISDMLIFKPPGLKEDYGLDIYFTSRIGGNSICPYDSLNLAFHVGDCRQAVKNNRLKVSHLLGIDSQFYYLEQIHSDKIVFTDDEDSFNLIMGNIKADALITERQSVPLMVMGADCPLILLTDKAKRWMAAVHSGWKGTISRIMTRVTDFAVNKFLSAPEDILVFIGPAIRSCCYHIDKERLKIFKKVYGQRDYYHQNGKIFIDLPSLIKRQAYDAGIPAKNILDSGLCTFCDKRFFSFRRDGATGRQAAIGIIRR